MGPDGPDCKTQGALLVLHSQHFWGRAPAGDQHSHPSAKSEGHCKPKHLCTLLSVFWLADWFKLVLRVHAVSYP